MSPHLPCWTFRSVLLFIDFSYFGGSGPSGSPAAGEDSVSWHRRSTGSSEGTRQVVRRPHLRHWVYQHGGHRDPGAPGGERNPVSAHIIGDARRWWRVFDEGQTNKSPSFSFGEMLAFTLTAFLELMDHGIVSWDLISLSFIKQVINGSIVWFDLYFSQWMSSCWTLSTVLDRRLREPADGGRVYPAALAGHPGEHGAEQPQPLPPGGARDHRGTAHRAPASVSTHTRTEAPSRTLTLLVGGEGRAVNGQAGGRTVQSAACRGRSLLQGVNGERVLLLEWHLTTNEVKFSFLVGRVETLALEDESMKMQLLLQLLPPFSCRLVVIIIP